METVGRRVETVGGRGETVELGLNYCWIMDYTNRYYDQSI